MSKVLIAIGIIVAVAGIAVAGLIYATPGQMQVMGITPEVAAVLFTGGLIILGLGVVTAAIESSMRMLRDLRTIAAQADRGAPTGPSVDLSQPAEDVTVAVAAASIPIETEPVITTEPSPSPPSAVDALIAESRAAAEKAIAASKEQAAETVIALDKAKADLDKALKVPEPASSEPAPETAEAAEELEDNQLYVVEERLIRGRPARVLSDGTVEAETDEGWMRFENLEHLEEYLDAMSPGAA
ncbi:MAG: hypothetical protein AB7U35_14160 [Sphingobium sp.]